MRIATDAADLLERLAPSVHKRGDYVSELIRQAALVAGLVEAPPSPEVTGLAALRAETEQQERRIRDLQDRIDQALAGYQSAE